MNNLYKNPEKQANLGTRRPFRTTNRAHRLGRPETMPETEQGADQEGLCNVKEFAPHLQDSGEVKHLQCRRIV